MINPLKKLYIFFCITSIFIISKAYAQSETISSKSFIDTPDVREIALSPDGNQILILKSQWESEALRFWDRIDIVEKSNIKNSRPLVKRDDLIVNWISWPKKDKIIASIIGITWTKHSYNLYNQLVAIDPISGKETRLYSSDIKKTQSDYKPSRIISYGKQDDPHVTLDIQENGISKLYNFDLSTNKKELVENGNSSTIDWILDENDNPIMRIDLDEETQFTNVYSRTTPKSAWHFEYKYYPFENNDFEVIGPSEIENKIYVIATPEKEDRASVWLYDIKKNAFETKIYGNDKYDISGAFVGGRPRHYIGAYYFDDILHYKFANEELQKDAELIQSNLGEGVSWYIYDSDFESKSWIIFSYGPKDAGSYWFFDRVTKKTSFISISREDLPSEKLSDVKPFDWVAQDGLKLRGYVTQKIRGTDKAPLIVMPHGGPEARDYESFDPWAQFFSSKGFIVFQPNFRGSFGYGKTFRESGFGQWGQKMRTDIEDGVDALIKTGQIDESQIFIIGASYGGYAALNALTQEKSRYLCGVSMSGVSDLKSMLDYTNNHPVEAIRKELNEFWVRRIGNPKTDMDNIIHNSPIYNLDKLSVPVLLIHGDKDSVVPISQSNKFYLDAKSKGKDVDLKILNEEGHSNWDQDNEVRVLSDIDYFITLCRIKAGKL